MLIVLVENIFVIFGKLVFQPSRHSYGYHLHSLPTWSFIHMMQTSCKCFWSSKTKGFLNFTFHNILVDGQYPFIIFRCLAIASLIEFEIENIIYTARHSSYLDQHIEIYSEGRTQDYLNFRSEISSCTCIAIIFQDLCFLDSVAAYKDSTEPMVPNCKDKVITLNELWSPLKPAG